MREGVQALGDIIAATTDPENSSRPPSLDKQNKKDKPRKHAKSIMVKGKPIEGAERSTLG